MNTPHTPAKWPFPPAQQSRPSRSRQASGRSAAAGGAKKKPGLTRGAMLADVCLVVMWGATIPGMMWLGAAGGF